MGKDEGWMMKDECWMMKDEWWMLNDEGWMIKAEWCRLNDECWMMKDEGWTFVNVVSLSQLKNVVGWNKPHPLTHMSVFEILTVHNPL